MKEVMFAVKEYDEDGVVCNDQIQISIDSLVSIWFDDMEDLKDFIEQLNVCVKEIKEDYPDIK